jgi:hypothetical protein
MRHPNTAPEEADRLVAALHTHRTDGEFAA